MRTFAATIVGGSLAAAGMAVGAAPAAAAKAPLPKLGTIIENNASELQACATTYRHDGDKFYAITSRFNNDGSSVKTTFSLGLLVAGQKMASRSFSLQPHTHSQPKAFANVADGISYLQATSRTLDGSAKVTSRIDPSQLPNCTSDPGLLHWGPHTTDGPQTCAFRERIGDDVGYSVAFRGNNISGTTTKHIYVHTNRGTTYSSPLLDQDVAPGTRTGNNFYYVQPQLDDHLDITWSDASAATSSTSEVDPSSAAIC